MCASWAGRGPGVGGFDWALGTFSVYVVLLVQAYRNNIPLGLWEQIGQIGEIGIILFRPSPGPRRAGDC